MALTLTNKRRWSVGPYRMVTADATFDSSYPTGGESLTAADLALLRLDTVVLTPAVNATPVAAVLRYDAANSKVLAYQADGGEAGLASLKQVADTTDLSAYSFQIVGIGV